MCGLLSGGSSGADVQPLYGDARVPYDCSHLFVAIDIGHFGDPAFIRAAAAAAAERVRGAARAPGVPRLFSPGEPEWHKRDQANGQVTLSGAVADMLVRMAKEMGVSASPLTP
jgi:LDH2 family malate/lactate/ureidoglycolate dehydrogenase